MTEPIKRSGPDAVARAEAGYHVITERPSRPSNTQAGSLSGTRPAAHEYHARGWALVLVPPNSKGPIVKGWQDLRPRLAEIERHLAAGGNLGVILGPASGSLVDIDLDCGEALILADTYLPPTEAIFGRASKPRSHRLYIAPGAMFEAFSDPIEKDTLVELRTSGNGNGAHQTIIPPSIVDGE